MSVKKLLIRKVTEDGRYSVTFCWKFQCKMLFGFRKHLTLDFPTVKRIMIPDLPSLFT